MSKPANPWASSLKPKGENLKTFLLTYSEAAALLRVCKRTVERMVATGEIPIVRVGRRAPRISRAALLRWIERAGAVAVTESEAEHGQCDF